MIVPPLSRRAAGEFARALDDRASANSRFAAYIELVDGMVEVGRELPKASPEFREMLRQRLSDMDVADGAVSAEDRAPSADPAGRSSHAHQPWRRRLAITGFAVGVIAGTATGTTLASSHALPGDALYGVKRTMEEVRLALADSDAAKGRGYLEIARTRLDEIHHLVEQNEFDEVEIDRIAATFADMHAALEHGSQLLITAYERTRDQSSLIDLYREVGEQDAELAEIEAIAPAELHGEARAARAFLQEVGEIISRKRLTDDHAAADGDTAGTAPDLGGASLRPDGLEKHPVIGADQPAPSAETTSGPAPGGSTPSESVGDDPLDGSQSADTPLTTPGEPDPSTATPPPEAADAATDNGSDGGMSTDQAAADVDPEAALRVDGEGEPTPANGNGERPGRGQSTPPGHAERGGEPPTPHSAPPGHSPPGLSTAPGLSHLLDSLEE